MANDTNAKSDPFNDKASEPTGDRADDDVAPDAVFLEQLQEVWKVSQV